MAHDLWRMTLGAVAGGRPVVRNPVLCNPVFGN
jgi:hypothetical protein